MNKNLAKKFSKLLKLLIKSTGGAGKVEGIIKEPNLEKKKK